jgi:hypothetical protein
MKMVIILVQLPKSLKAKLDAERALAPQPAA